MVASALRSSVVLPQTKQPAKPLTGQVSIPALARSQDLRRVRVSAEGATKEKEDKKEDKKEEKKPFTPPSLDPSTPAPIFGGSTGGLLRKAQEEEFYVITWEAKKEEIFEMPTGGAAIANKGPNLLKLARKEQCLALLAQLRGKFKTDGVVYRVFPNGEVQHLHPKDGVYPEKVNPGREAVGTQDRSIGKNTNPVKIKFTGRAGTYDI